MYKLQPQGGKRFQAMFCLGYSLLRADDDLAVIIILQNLLNQNNIFFTNQAKLLYSAIIVLWFDVE